MSYSLIYTLRQKRTITQLIAGCLFSIFFLNSIVSFLVFEIKRREIRHEIKHGILNKLPDSQLFAFTIPENFDKNEFEYNGVMYDVIRKKSENGKVVFLCFEDRKETELNRSIEATVKNDLANSPIKKTQKLLIKFIKTSFIPFDSFEFAFPPLLIIQSNFHFIEALSAVFNNIPYSPPDL